MDACFFRKLFGHLIVSSSKQVVQDDFVQSIRALFAAKQLRIDHRVERRRKLFIDSAPELAKSDIIVSVRLSDIGVSLIELLP